MRFRITGENWVREYRVRRDAAGREWSFEGEEGSHDLQVQSLDGTSVLRLTLGETTYSLTLLPGNQPGQPLRFLLDDDYYELRVESETDLLDALVGGGASASGAEEIRSVMPGVVPRVLVNEGDPVEADQPLLILEAMKMENEIRSPRPGTIRRLLVSPGQTVAAGELLAELEL